MSSAPHGVGRESPANDHGCCGPLRHSRQPPGASGGAGGSSRPGRGPRRRGWRRRTRLSEREARWIASWPDTHRVAVAGTGDVLFCRATPRSDSEIITRLSEESALRPVVEAAGAAFVVCGHTHMQSRECRQRGDAVRRPWSLLAADRPTARAATNDVRSGGRGASNWRDRRSRRRRVRGESRDESSGRARHAGTVHPRGNRMTAASNTRSRCAGCTA